MTNRGLLTLLLSTLFVTSGCLDGLNQQDDNDFWGEDCEETPDQICTSGPAPDFALVDQFDKPVNMSQFKGKVVVITFIFTHCPDICPAVTYQMKKLSEELGDDYNESVYFSVLQLILKEILLKNSLPSHPPMMPHGSF